MTDIFGILYLRSHIIFGEEILIWRLELLGVAREISTNPTDFMPVHPRVRGKIIKV